MVPGSLTVTRFLSCLVQACLFIFFGVLLNQQYLLNESLRYISLEEGYGCSEVAQEVRQISRI